jgi:hypothetical protein
VRLSCRVDDLVVVVVGLKAGPPAIVPYLKELDVSRVAAPYLGARPSAPYVGHGLPAAFRPCRQDQPYEARLSAPLTQWPVNVLHATAVWQTTLGSGAWADRRPVRWRQPNPLPQSR